MTRISGQGQQDIRELEQRRAALLDQASKTKLPGDKDRLEGLAEGLHTTGRRLIHERHDRAEAEEAQRVANHRARMVIVEQQQDAEIRSDLLSRWQGTVAEFEAIYPELRRQWLADRALGRIPAAPRFQPKVTF